MGGTFAPSEKDSAYTRVDPHGPMGRATEAASDKLSYCRSRAHWNVTVWLCCADEAYVVGTTRMGLNRPAIEVHLSRDRV